MEPINSDSATVYGQTVKVVKKATEKIYNIGGLVSGALWSGAALFSGTNDEQGSNSFKAVNASTESLTVDPSGKGITHEDILLNK